MIYKVHFEPRGGYWCVQFQMYLYFWRTVTKEVRDKGKVRYEPVVFDTVEEAEAYVSQRGIDKSYDRMPTRTSMSAIQAGLIGGSAVQIPHGWRLVQDLAT